VLNIPKARDIFWSKLLNLAAFYSSCVRLVGVDELEVGCDASYASNGDTPLLCFAAAVTLRCAG
jgi:hypothetical protein